MPAWFASLPWYVRGPVVLGGGLMSAFSSSLPSWLGPLGFYLGAALACFGIVASIWVWFKGPRVKLDPIHLIGTGFFGIVLSAALILWGIIWQSRITDNRPVVVIAPSTNQPPPVFSGPTKLIPNTSPDPSNSNLENVARLIQLRKAAGEVSEAKRMFDTVSANLETRMKPTYTGMSMGISDQRSTWRKAQDTVKNINDSLYQNRPLDFASVPQLSNPLNKAPGEDVYGDDGDGKYRFRSFHFLNVNVSKQMEALLTDIGNETEAVTKRIESTPEAKDFRRN
jgi:hypothetical protein